MGIVMQPSKHREGPEFRSGSREVTVGRSPVSDLVLEEPGVSWQHAVIRCAGQCYTAEDLGSKNGTFVNGRRIGVNETLEVRDGDEVVFGPTAFHFRVENTPSRDDSTTMSSEAIEIGAGLFIGRDRECDLVLESSSVSRRHCEITRDRDSFVLTDLDSTNGTFVNGHRVMAHTLRDEDVVQIGLHNLRFSRGVLHTTNDDGNIRIDILGVGQVVGSARSRKQILRDVTFAVMPKEFVAIVGPSGAGKSTLMNAINGFRPASEGLVCFNYLDYYSHRDLFRTAVGVVPQDDVIHRELVVEDALRYSAELRLPQDTSSVEIEATIDLVIDELDLVHRRSAVIRSLSGGERKRVNIAVELLTQPSLLFLDEPTAGLDPALEKRVFELLRRLADRGRTVMLVTHAAESLQQCDMVAFVAGGRMVFYGRPNDALSFFEANTFVDAYAKLTDDPSAATYWAEKFLNSKYYERNIARRMDLERINDAGLRETSPLPQSKPGPSFLRQFSVLSRRYIQVLRGDPRNLMILLGQAPLIAAILLLIMKSNIFSAAKANSPATPPPIADAPKLLFLLAISAIWLGTCNAAREITKERAIYRRERLISLSIAPYLLSKVIVLIVICAVQSLLLLLIVCAKVDFRISDTGMLELLAVLVTTACASMLFGLMLSALVTSNDQAVSLIPIALIPQIVFSGLLVSLDQMGDLPQLISSVTISRWSFGAMCNVCRISERYRLAGWGAQTKSVFDTDMTTAFASLAGIAVVSVALAALLLRLKDREHT